MSVPGGAIAGEEPTLATYRSLRTLPVSSGTDPAGCRKGPVLIPVFVSRPTTLSSAQESSRKVILAELDRAGLEPRALGRSDYPTVLPLREVLSLPKHCSGGVILGFEQLYVPPGAIYRRGTSDETLTEKPASFPTPWNHLEAGLLYSFELPLLVFSEGQVRGGVFDLGTSEAFVHPMPISGMSANSKSALRAVFQKWQAEVRAHYYK